MRPSPCRADRTHSDISRPGRGGHVFDMRLMMRARGGVSTGQMHFQLQLATRTATRRGVIRTRTQFPPAPPPPQTSDTDGHAAAPSHHSPLRTTWASIPQAPPRIRHTRTYTHTQRCTPARTDTHTYTNTNTPKAHPTWRRRTQRPRCARTPACSASRTWRRECGQPQCGPRLPSSAPAVRRPSPTPHRARG
jgi:hypothetical protein